MVDLPQGGNLEGRLLGITSLNSSKRSMSFVPDHYLYPSPSQSILSFIHINTSTCFLVSARDPGKKTLFSPSQFVAGLFSGDEVDFYTPEGSSQSDSWFELASSVMKALCLLSSPFHWSRSPQRDYFWSAKVFQEWHRTSLTKKR